MKKRSIVSSSLGNVLEWYDFGLFAIFSPLLSALFFPASKATALIATFGLFAVGFICRPLGALLFGYLGDRYGRASTLRLSILMISLPTLLIALLPTWSQAGILAPLLLTIIRMWQGISLGGEYSGNLIYLAESAPSRWRAAYTSLASTGSNLGILLATLIGAGCTTLIPPDALMQWGWRIPWLLSGVLSLLIWLTRLQLTETPTFTHLQQQHQLTRHPIRHVFQHNIGSMLLTLGMVCLGSTFYYFVFIWIPAFLRTERHFSASAVSGMLSVLFFSMLFLVPAAGWLCDKTGRRKLFLFNAIAVTLLVIPGFTLLQTTSLSVTLAILLGFTLISALEQATTSVMVVENFPLPARYTGLSLSYNLGNGLLGGTVPIISATLTTKLHSLTAPAFYITVCSIISGLTVFFFIKETRGKSIQIKPHHSC